MSTNSAAIGAGASHKALRQIITPEGVPLTVELASRGERAGAVLLDLLFLYGSLVLLGILFWQTLGSVGLSDAGELAVIIFVLISFFVRCFYFIFFELRWDGMTPGKRILKTRVIDRHGGPLTAEAIFARNFMREVELFLPMSLLLSGTTSQAGAWANLLGIIWTGVLVLMPFFNKERLRVGDMVAGTWVVNAARSQLEKDLAGAVAAVPDDSLAEGAYRFTPAELSVYGIHELQTLEDVLRGGTPEVMDEVAKRICRKIGWQPDDVTDSRPFLEAFYRAQRLELESKMLFGVRRRNKFDNGDRVGGDRKESPKV